MVFASMFLCNCLLTCAVHMKGLGCDFSHMYQRKTQKPALKDELQFLLFIYFFPPPDSVWHWARLDTRQQRPAQAAQITAGERLQERSKQRASLLNDSASAVSHLSPADALKCLCPRINLQTVENTASSAFCDAISLVFPLIGIFNYTNPVENSNSFSPGIRQRKVSHLKNCFSVFPPHSSSI